MRSFHERALVESTAWLHQFPLAFGRDFPHREVYGGTASVDKHQRESDPRAGVAILYGPGSRPYVAGPDPRSGAIRRAAAG